MIPFFIYKHFRVYYENISKHSKRNVLDFSKLVQVLSENTILLTTCIMYLHISKVEQLLYFKNIILKMPFKKLIYLDFILIFPVYAGGLYQYVIENDTLENDTSAYLKCN